MEEEIDEQSHAGSDSGQSSAQSMTASDELSSHASNGGDLQFSQTYDDSRSQHRIINRQSNGLHVRKGKWTIEEENYTNKIISLFNRGQLPIPAGTTLRSYLSERLNCDPMRITKKFAGATSIGKVVYQPAESFHDRRMEDPSEMEELRRLEALFLEKLNGQENDSKPPIPLPRHSRDSREATSPATAKIAEVVEKIRAHDRGLRSNDRRQVISKVDDASTRKPTSSSSMKRILSAPNFSQLSTLHTPWKQKNTGEIVDTSRYPIEDVYKRTFTSRMSHAIERINDQNVTEIENSTRIDNTLNTSQSLHRAKKRSQSVMDFQEYEHLTSVMMNDQAASDLLLQFSANLREYSKTSVPFVKLEEQALGNGSIQKDKIIYRGFDDSVVKMDPFLTRGSFSQQSQQSDRPSPEYDVGLALDEEPMVVTRHQYSQDSLIQRTLGMSIDEKSALQENILSMHPMKRTRSNDFFRGSTDNFIGSKEIT